MQGFIFIHKFYVCELGIILCIRTERRIQYILTQGIFAFRFCFHPLIKEVIDELPYPVMLREQHNRLYIVDDKITVVHKPPQLIHPEGHILVVRG
jgi:hypothetical protein